MIGVVGDSNSQDGWGTAPTTRWVSLLMAELVDTPIINAAHGGAMVTDPFRNPRLPWGWREQWERLRQIGDPRTVIAALGTNDLTAGVTPRAIVEGYAELCAAVHPRPLFIVPVPQRQPPTSGAAAVNRMLASVGFTVLAEIDAEPPLLDAVHLTHEAQRTRAAAMRAALRLRRVG